MKESKKRVDMNKTFTQFPDTNLKSSNYDQFFDHAGRAQTSEPNRRSG